MKFSAVHKLATYLMAACAFLALALSGELRPFAVALGGVGFVVSWFWEPPRVRPERWTLWWNLAALALFALTLVNALGTGDWIIAGSDYLIFLLVNKLFNRRTSRDHQWIYVLSFLMLVAGTTLNAEISYALCFLGYVVTATWALILFHLRRDMEDNFLLKHSTDSSSERVEVERILSSRRIVGPTFLAATSAVSLGIFVVSAVLFLIFPRVGFGFFFQRGHGARVFAGFSENVTLGQHGLIRNDPTVVMRVQINDARYRSASAPELHWRGVAFDHYEGGKWSRSQRAFRTEGRTRAGVTGTRVTLDSGRAFGDLERALRQEIFLEPIETNVLFAASRPLAFEVTPTSPSGGFGRFGQNEEVRYSRSGGIRYVAYSDPTVPSPQALAASPDVNADRYATYLQVPIQITPRVRELARHIVAGQTTPYGKAQAIYTYLRREYQYTLLMEAPAAGQEPLDFFLIERKKGHCEYFSSAMAILLRLVGVPTRNVDGFLGGEWNEYGGYIAVRGGDAHSWLEVWFEGVGWVTYDPTPPGEVTAMTRGGGGILDRMRRMLDTLQLQYFKWVMDYDLGRQLGLMKSVAGLFGDEDGRGPSGQAFKAWMARNGTTLVGVIAFGVLVIAVPFVWRRRRRKQTQGAGAQRVVHPIVPLYLRAARALARRGHARPPAQTPREHARALAARGVPGAAPFGELTESYYLAVYGTRAVDLAAARVLVERVRDELARAS